MIRKVVMTCAGSLVLLAAGASPALAGEITGNGKTTPAPEHTNSICAFSGQNHVHPGELPSRVQSYGQLVRSGLKAEEPSPGVACNGHSGFLAGGGGAP